MSFRSRRARVSALAKINLGLKVLHRRPDGFHELRTVFQTISLADSLEIEVGAAHRTTVGVASNFEIAGENLVATAARRVLDEVKTRCEVTVRLTKQIPMGAGLGGGSSDAAAVLLALPVLTGRNISLERLIALGGGLGSDVPFFLLGGTAVATGRGTEVYPLADGPARHALLVTPGVHVSTAAAYSALGRELTSAAPENIISSFESLAWTLAGAQTKASPAAENDFESAVFRDHPQLGRIKRQLERLGASLAMMSGSGSAVFGLFDTKAEALKARRALPVDATVVKLVSRARYRSMWWRRLGMHATGKEWPPRSRYA